MTTRIKNSAWKKAGPKRRAKLLKASIKARNKSVSKYSGGIFKL